jgi:hypothetical protein
MAEPVESLNDKAQDPQKCLMIGIIDKDFGLGIATRCDVVQGAGVFDAEGTSHEYSLS